MKLRQLLLAALFAALMCATRFIPPIPIPPTPLSFTLQTLVVFVAGLMLEPKYALASMLVYTALGLLGLPVFSQGGGIGYVLLPSFGFIIGFSACAFTISVLVRKNVLALYSLNNEQSKKILLIKIVGFSLLSIVALYVCGITYMYCIYKYYLEQTVNLLYLIAASTGIFLVIDIVKFAVALPFSMAVLKRLPTKFTK